MTKLVLITIAGVTVLALLFEVSRDEKSDHKEDLYYEMIEGILEAQPQTMDLTWQLGSLPIPGTEGEEEDFIELTPREVDWRTGADIESRTLPDPPPAPTTPPRHRSAFLEPVVIARGTVQTAWQMIRTKGLGDQSLLKAQISGKTITDRMAKLWPFQGYQPQLHLYQSYVMPFKVYRYLQEVKTPPSSRFPMGKRVVEVGLPWVEWEEPVEVSATTCTTSFTAKALEYKDLVPRGKYELLVIE